MAADQEFYVKVGDSSRTLTDTLTQDGSAIDLTGASVVLVWKPCPGTVERKSATIVTAASGDVSYDLNATDVLSKKDVYFEWEITFADTTKLTVPTNETYLLHIVKDLG